LVAVVITAIAGGAAPAARADQSGAPAGGSRADAGYVSSGNGLVCTVLESGALRCWGANSYGQLGLGSTTQYDFSGPTPKVTGIVGDDEAITSVPPVSLGAGRTAVSVNADDRQSCAILDTGRVRCWGLGSFGALGNGSSSDVGDDELPSAAGEVDLPAGRRATTLALGADVGCVILDDASTRCWGSGTSGDLAQGNTDTHGDGVVAPNTVPITFAGGLKATSISAGGNTLCAVLTDGSVACWGDNAYGQLGQGNTTEVGGTGAGTPVRVPLPAGRTAVAVDGASGYFCAIVDHGDVVCWGLNTSAQLGQGFLGDGDTTFGIDHSAIGDQPGEKPVPVPLGAGHRAVALSAGSGTCVIIETGQLRCWGDNTYGEFGLGVKYDWGADPLLDTTLLTIGDQAGELPVEPALPAGRTAVAVSVGSNLCVTLDDQSLRCTGPSATGGFATGQGDAWGGEPGQSPATEQATPLGARVGRDSDGDLLPDSRDACPTAAAATPTGCPAEPDAGSGGGAGTGGGTGAGADGASGTGGDTVAGGGTGGAGGAPAPSGTPAPAGPDPTLLGTTVSLRGKRLTIAAVLVPKTKTCPRRAAVRVRIKGQKTVTGTLKVRVRTILTKHRCVARGTIILPSTVAPKTKVSVTIKAKHLKTRTLRATRA
jgi:alpha-tubulin suppressor-like RCC1 family protein